MPLRIANAAGFLGDRPHAARELVERAEVDYLTLEYLAELTLSILARLREKDPDAGYARDFLDVLTSLCPALYLQGQLKLVTNAGGMNPRACSAAAGRILSAHGCENMPIGIVTGDELTGQLEVLLLAGCTLENFDTGQPFSELTQKVISANAYLGAEPIRDLLAAGARMIITGRVADVSLTVGPAVHHYGWSWDEWDRLAGASVVGHLIECGAQVTGGYHTAWQHLDLTHVGYPIAEIDEHAAATITKPAGTGGAVTRETVVAQLLYEIGDPAHYLTPDVEVDFTTVQLEDHGHDRVTVRGATGRPAPATCKVSLVYENGYTAAAHLVVYGRDCRAKAKTTAQMVWDRVERTGFKLEAVHAELLGTGDSVPGLHEAPNDLREIVLRLAVRDSRREAVAQFTKEVAPLITSGPSGLAGYATGRSPIYPVFALWPTLIPRDSVVPHTELRTAKQWAKE
jgi:hypothetical protein